MSLPVAEAYQQKFYNWVNKKYGYSKNNMNADPILYTNAYEKFQQEMPITLEERKKMINELYYRTEAGQRKKVLNNAANTTRTIAEFEQKAANLKRAANITRKIAEFEQKAANLKRAANERAAAKAEAKAKAVVIHQNAHVKLYEANKALRAAYNKIKNRKVSNLSLRDFETLQPHKNSRSTASFASADELVGGNKNNKKHNRTKRLKRQSSPVP